MGDMGRIPVGIVGASGYGGVQLVRLLMDHPRLELAYLGGESSAGQAFAELYPHLGHRVKQIIEPLDLEKIADRCQVVFLSLPNGLAYKMAPTLLEKGCKVLDLSADYRFSDLATYTAWYGGDRADQAVAENSGLWFTGTVPAIALLKLNWLAALVATPQRVCWVCRRCSNRD